MAGSSIIKPIIKKWDDADQAWDIVYPKTTIDQVINLATAITDLQDDIDEAHDIAYQETCPGANNDGPGKKLYVGSDCGTKYNGWIYHII